MQAINYHEKSHSSIEGLNAALKKVKHRRGVIANTLKARRTLADQRGSILQLLQDEE